MSSTDEEREFQEVLQKIQAGGKDPLKAKALLAILKLVFYDGFEQKEATELKIEDVWQGGNIVDQITPTAQRGPINLSEETKSALLDYINALQSGQASAVDSASPLFPRYSGNSGRRSLRRDFQSLQSPDFDTMRRSGVKHFYNTLVDRGVDPREALEETGCKFRLSDRAVGDILKGVTQPAGEKPIEKRSANARVMDLWEKMENESNWKEAIKNNRIPKLVEDLIRAVDDNSKNEPKPYGTNTKDIFLDEIIKRVRLLKTKNMPKETAPDAAGANREMSKRVNWIELIKKAEEESRLIQEKRSQSRTKEDEEKKLITDLEDPDNSHTPEQKFEYKKTKLLELVERIKAESHREDEA